MTKLDRRRFIGASALAGSVALAPPSIAATSAAPPEVTRILAKYIVNAKPTDLPAPVQKEATRTLLNWVGCTLGGSRNEAVEIAISALKPFFGPAQATVLGRKERIDVFNAALLNGISSHILDYD